jgi:hypothetical protein
MSAEALPSELEELDTFRDAARRIVRNTASRKLSRKEQLVALVRLAERARRETVLPELVQGAIWAECEGLLWRREPLDVPPDPVESALLKLHQRGLIRCPTWQRGLPGEPEFSAWAERRRLRREELEAFEGAVP